MRDHEHKHNEEPQMTETAIRKQKMRAEVLRHETLAPGIRSLELRVPELPAAARPGQFVGVYTGDGAMLLPRPISICDSGDEKELRLVYRVAGKGTAEIAGLKAGEETQILGILGNGYPVEELKNKRVLLLGGGIGIPPMLLLAKQLSALNSGEEKDQSPVITVLGYRDAQMFLREEFEKYALVFIATEDGSVGTKGNVLTAVKQEGIRADAICACGPMPMLRAVKAYAAQEGIACYISLEERMACGVGACLGCVAKTTREDEHSHVKNTRICTEGPVFDAEYVDI